MHPKTAFWLAAGVIAGFIAFAYGLSEAHSDTVSCGSSTLRAGDRCQEINYKTGEVTVRDVGEQRRLNHNKGVWTAVGGGVLAVGCLVGGGLTAFAASRPAKPPKNGGEAALPPTGWTYQPANAGLPVVDGLHPHKILTYVPVAGSAHDVVLGSHSGYPFAAYRVVRSVRSTASGEELARCVYGVCLLELPRPLPTTTIHRVLSRQERAGVAHPVALTRPYRGFGFARRYRVTSPSPELTVAVLTRPVTKMIYDTRFKALHFDGRMLLHEFWVPAKTDPKDLDPKRLKADLDKLAALADQLLASSEAVPPPRQHELAQSP